jgi:hypothetical protein
LRQAHAGRGANPSRLNDGGARGFPGLALRGLPEEGILEVRVSFVGMRWDNAVSLASFMLLAAAALYLRNESRKSGRGSGVVSPSPPLTSRHGN